MNVNYINQSRILYTNYRLIFVHIILILLISLVEITFSSNEIVFYVNVSLCFVMVASAITLVYHYRKRKQKDEVDQGLQDDRKSFNQIGIVLFAIQSSTFTIKNIFEINYQMNVKGQLFADEFIQVLFYVVSLSYTQSLMTLKFKILLQNLLIFVNLGVLGVQAKKLDIFVEFALILLIFINRDEILEILDKISYGDLQIIGEPNSSRQLLQNRDTPINETQTKEEFFQSKDTKQDRLSLQFQNQQMLQQQQHQQQVLSNDRQFFGESNNQYKPQLKTSLTLRNMKLEQEQNNEFISQNLYQEIIDFLPLGIAFFNSNDFLVFKNSSISKILCVTEQNQILNQLRKLICGQQSDDFSQYDLSHSRRSSDKRESSRCFSPNPYSKQGISNSSINDSGAIRQQSRTSSVKMIRQQKKEESDMASPISENSSSTIKRILRLGSLRRSTYKKHEASEEFNSENALSQELRDHQQIEDKKENKEKVHQEKIIEQTRDIDEKKILDQSNVSITLRSVEKSNDFRENIQKNVKGELNKLYTRLSSQDVQSKIKPNNKANSFQSFSQEKDMGFSGSQMKSSKKSSIQSIGSNIYSNEQDLKNNSMISQANNFRLNNIGEDILVAQNEQSEIKLMNESDDRRNKMPYQQLESKELVSAKSMDRIIQQQKQQNQSQESDDQEYGSSNQDLNFSQFRVLNKENNTTILIQFSEIEIAIRAESEQQIQAKSINLICFIVEDITSQIENENLKREIENQSKMIVSVSHALRTPLNCSINLSKVLKSLVSPQISQNFVNPIYSSNRLLLNIINNMIDFSSSQEDQIDFNMAKFSLKELVNDVHEILLPQIQQKGLEFSFEIKSELENQITNDRQRIEQIMVNLMENSIQYCNRENGKIKVEIEKGNFLKYNKNIHLENIQEEIIEEVQQEQEEQVIAEELIKISIFDNGIGIKPNQLAQINEDIKNTYIMELDVDLQQFESQQEYQQNRRRKSFASDQRGTALGLIFSASLAQGLSNFRPPIKIVSQFKKGSIFSFFIQDFSKQVSTVQNPSQTNSSQLILRSQKELSDDTTNRKSVFTWQESQRQVSIQKSGLIEDHCEENLSEGSRDYYENIEEKIKYLQVMAGDQYITQYDLATQSNKEKLEKLLSIDKAFTQPDLQEEVKFQTRYSQTQICKAHAQILIVDDDQFNVMTLSEMIQMINSDLVIDNAFDGFQAVEQVESQAANKKYSTCCFDYYTLILMDIDMPRQNGYTATNEIIQFYRIQENQEKFRIQDNSHVVACSAFISKEQKLQANQVGMKDYICKPVDFKSLAELLQNIFQF